MSGTGQPKYARVAAAIRDQVADGTLRPGQPAPSAAALARATGFSTLTCRRALRVLVADGVLVPGASASARPRVAGQQGAAGHDEADAARALSAALAARRHAAGLTQPGLALITGVSVTTIGHAETGRLWQSRKFWERADTALDAAGGLLCLHDVFRAAGAEQRKNKEQAGQERVRLPLPARPAPSGRPGQRTVVTPSYITIVWGDGTMTTVRPPEGGPGSTAENSHGYTADLR
jgi:DNA-binding transcriptional regulator YhcF (GntR family)